MPKQCRFAALPLTVVAFLMSSGAAAPANAVAAAVPDVCDLESVSAAKEAFLRISALREANPVSASDDEVRDASTNYLVKAEACYQTLYAGKTTTKIDDGGVWFTPDGAQPFVTFGTKWGAGSPFSGGTSTLR